MKTALESGDKFTDAEKRKLSAVKKQYKKGGFNDNTPKERK